VAQTGNYHVDNLPAAGPDGKPRRGIKAAFYLTDVPDDKHGPLRIVPGSQGKPQPGRMDGMNVLAMAGDVVLSRPDVWHRSTFNESAVARRSLFVSYCAL
jgi:ectoine hydroxylase-related dioxygenase (phytanoyl-CoA dioxygenase family)